MPNQEQAAAIRSACAADYKSHCPGIEPGGAAAWSCLQANVKKFAAPCQQAVNAVAGAAAAGAAPAGGAAAGGAAAKVVLPPPRPLPLLVQLRLLRTDCGADFRSFCAGVPLGEGRAIDCLVEHGPSLSPLCLAAMEALGR
jgi:hypothetical protein